jgi:hypothetical protein
MLSTNDFVGQYERFTASVMYTLTFGIRIGTGKEWRFQQKLENLEHMLTASDVGAWIVDAFLTLNYLPRCLAPWKKTAEAWHEQYEGLQKRNMQDGLARPGYNWCKDFCGAKEAKQVDSVAVA